MSYTWNRACISCPAASFLARLVPASPQNSRVFLRWFEQRRYRKLWSDGHRSLLTLESFAETEEDGGRDLVAASRRFTDPVILGHLRRHADDELRHARLFRERAADMAQEQGRHLGAKSEELGRAYDLSGKRSPAEVDAHGFYSAGMLDESGTVPYIAMLHLAEKRAARIFACHMAAARSAGDTRTSEVFAAILHDEHYHVAWTKKVLEDWRSQGRGAEVDRAQSQVRRGRFMESWRSLGLRSAGKFAHLFLALAFWTVLAPFGLLARRVRPASPGWRAPHAGGRLGSQY
ncbi:MAG: hypothetical protein V3T22_08535 [Planctomycetota bacterium]